MIIFEILFLSAVILLALFYFGWGAAQILVTGIWLPYRAFLIPFIGLALIIVWDYLALFFGFNLTHATWALFVLALILNALLFGKMGREREPFRFTFSREQVIVLAFALLAFIAAVAPLARYGYLTIIGENWDYENSLPLADYLQTYSMNTLAQAPPNPLLEDLTGRHIALLPWAFSYLLATFNVFLNRQALDLFAILLGVLRGLSVIAAFIFCRVGVKMSTRASLVTAGLYSLNGLLLWFTYWNFGPHNTALTLLPLALTAGIVVLRERRRRDIFLAALLLAALNIAFNPALTLVLLMLGAIGLYYLIAPSDAQIPKRLFDPTRVRVLVAGLGMLALALLLSFPTLLHLGDLYREYYASVRIPVGLREFVPLSDGYGLSLYTLERVVGHIIPTAWLYGGVERIWDIAGLPLLLFILGVSGWGLIQIARNRVQPTLTRGERATWFLLLATIAAYLALLRLPFLRPYPYGFLKALSLVNLPLLALFSLGLFSLPLNARVLTRAVWIGASAVFAIASLTFALSLEQYFKPAPPFFDADDLQIRAVTKIVPPNARVFLTDRAQAQTIPMGLAAYALMSRELHGNVKTGYTEMHNVEPGAVYDYALLARGENPMTRGYDAKPLWENETFALYARAPEVEYQRVLDAETIAPNPLHITIGATEIVSGTKKLDEAKGTRAAALAFASFIPQQVTISYADITRELDIPAGLSSVALPKLETPTTLTITPHVEQTILDSAVVTIPHDFPDAQVRLWIPYAQLRASQNDNAASVIPSPDTILVTCTSRTARELDARCFVVNPQQRELTWRWIVRGTTARTREERVIAQAETKARPQAQIDFLGTLSNGLGRMQFDNAATVDFKPQTIPDGNYRGDLEIYDGAILLARIELYRFQVQKNQTRMTRSAPQDGALVIAQP